MVAIWKELNNNHFLLKAVVIPQLFFALFVDIEIVSINSHRLMQGEGYARKNTF